MKKLLLLLLCLPLFGKAQTFNLRAGGEDVKVLRAPGDTLRNAWAGGIANPLFSNIDLNGDGRQDLFLFDHFDSTISIFINQGSGVYDYVPDYAGLFPPLRVWAFLRDYNHDDKPDIYAYTHDGGAGFEIFKNVSTSSEIKFQLVRPFLETKKSRWFSSSQVYTDQVNMPAIADVDGDGDMDVLAMDIFGAYVSLYRSRDADSFGTDYSKYDSLFYQYVDECWGFVTGSPSANTVADSFIHPPQLHFDCGGIHKKRRHAGANLMTFDKDGDGDHDLLYSDINGAGFSLVENGRIQTGKPARIIDTMIGLDSTFIQRKLPYYPGAFHVDADGDGDRDLLTAQLNRVGGEGIHSVHFYQNSGTDAKPDFRFKQDDFLQRDMIDLGLDAVPTFYDRNGDGRPEWMVVATQGNIGEKSYGYGRLIQYRNVSATGKAVFQKVNDDYLGLTRENLYDLAPSFGDLDGDGRIDLVTGDATGSLRWYRNTGSGSNDTFVLTAHPSLSGIDVGNASFPAIGDIDGDNLPDLVVGEQDGNFNYYSNKGKKTSGSLTYYDFQLATETLGGVLTRDTNFNSPGMSSPVIADLNGNGNPDIISGSGIGNMYVFLDVKNRLGVAWQAEPTVFYNPLKARFESKFFGQKAVPAVAQLDGDSLADVIIGNEKGGMYYYKNTSMLTATEKISPERPILSIYPNPAQDRLFLKGESTGEYDLQLTDILGRNVLQQAVRFPGVESLQVQRLPKGVYVLRLQQGGAPVLQEKVVLK